MLLDLGVLSGSPGYLVRAGLGSNLRPRMMGVLEACAIRHQDASAVSLAPRSPCCQLRRRLDGRVTGGSALVQVPGSHLGTDLPEAGLARRRRVSSQYRSNPMGELPGHPGIERVVQVRIRQDGRAGHNCAAPALGSRPRLADLGSLRLRATAALSSTKAIKARPRRTSFSASRA
jgi:hypothetical protein